MSNALISAEQQCRFHCHSLSPLGVAYVPLSQILRDQARDERRPRRQLVDDDVLMEGVRAVAERTEPVKSWDAKRGREVPVRRAAGRALGEVAPHLRATSRASAIQRARRRPCAPSAGD